jgi:DNA-binding NarL/FixJ family response regulator
MIRVLVADDHPFVRQGIAAALLDEPDLLLVGEARDGDDVLRLCEEREADVLLLDLRMPGRPVLDVIHALQESCPELSILMLTAQEDEHSIRTTLKAGASGYMFKQEATQVLAQAIRTVHVGGTWLSRAATETLVRPHTETPSLDNAQLNARDREGMEHRPDRCGAPPRRADGAQLQQQDLPEAGSPLAPGGDRLGPAAWLWGG